VDTNGFLGYPILRQTHIHAHIEYAQLGSHTVDGRNLTPAGAIGIPWNPNRNPNWCRDLPVHPQSLPIVDLLNGVIHSIKGSLSIILFLTIYY